MPNDLTLIELSALADVPTRTIRYYIAQGLMPSPVREGPGTRYPASALHRLRLIRQLQRGHQPLAEIRKRLSGVSDAEVEALIVAEKPEPPEGDALEYVRSVLRSTSPPAIGSDLAPPPSSPTRAAPFAPLRKAIGTVPGTPASPPGAPAPEPDLRGPSAPPSSPQGLERSQWERIVLEPDVELHLRRPLSRIANKRVERLIALARELLEEDQP